MAVWGRLATPVRRSFACAHECNVASRIGRGRQASWRRSLSTYAENPAQWQSDPCVQMYGQLLAVRDAQPDAFLVAAETLRAQLNLPRDLRASASRTRASVLFQTAGKLYEDLQMTLEGPWPGQGFDEALAAASRACEAYEDALAETSDPDLCKDVETHCPEWPAALAATEAAYVEVRKLRAVLREREVRWHGRQAEHARAISDAARRPGSSGDGAARATEALHAAGLGLTVEEEDLLRIAVTAADSMIVECEASKRLGNLGSQTVLMQLRSKGQALKIMMLKDLAIASAMTYNLEVATEHIISALREIPADPAVLTESAAEQLRAAAKGVLELCGRELQRSDTQSQGKLVTQWATDISEAIALFDSRCEK